MHPMLSAKRLISLDETGVTANMVRRYGRGPRSKRVRGYTPAGHWNITTPSPGFPAKGSLRRSSLMSR